MLVVPYLMPEGRGTPRAHALGHLLHTSLTASSPAQRCEPSLWCHPDETLPLIRPLSLSLALSCDGGCNHEAVAMNHCVDRASPASPCYLRSLLSSATAPRLNPERSNTLHRPPQPLFPPSAIEIAVNTQSPSILPQAH